MRQSRIRRKEMLEEIADGKINVKLLAERFGISASTVRRDLQRLSGDKKVMRIYGGAMLLPQSVEENFDARECIHTEEKKAIAKKASEIIKDDETVILDGGSTISLMAPYIKERKITVITNNLKLASTLASAPGIHLIFLGGAIRSLSMTSYGPLAEEAMRWLTADRLFTSSNGVVPGRGLCEATIEQISLKRLMMKQSRKVYVLADFSKLGCANQPAWVELPEGWTLITDANEALCKPFTMEACQILRAN